MTAQADPVLATKPQNRVWKKFRSHRSAMLGGILVTFFILIALAAPILPIPDPAATDWGAVRKAPSAAHWLGTDEIGRDVLARMVWGAQASLLAGVVSVGIALLLGVPLGILAGYFGGWIDAVISRCTEALLAAPFLILAIALAAFLGPSLTNAMIAIGISAMPIFVRLTRGQVLNIKTADYVESAHAIGLPRTAFCRAISFPTCCRRSWCRPRSPSPPPSSQRHRCRFWALVNNPLRPVGARC